MPNDFVLEKLAKKDLKQKKWTSSSKFIYLK